ncbi:adenylyl cyclase [Puniceicoccales bacterium CK1056]|uniref:Adenylyl cyclase n=2 Tax=Oceanipulchritudo coccoides TaxID=2706888 RepID=A0A6B2M245_9BACT|nr:adenylyl cyclase [Oceanipulchritudo coccoides]
MVFDPAKDQGEIQAILDGLHKQQKHAQFGEERYALLFKPGEYDLDVTVDYHVEAAGLGRVPGDVRINGSVQSVATTHTNNVTIMFWRSASNFEVHPRSTEDLIYWAVSQAAPYRRMHILGDLQFDKGGWASGGLLANSIVEGNARLTTGQQWFTRNSELGSWSGGNWNRTFVGTIGAATEEWPVKPNTVVQRTPVIREKPFLLIDESGGYSVFVPALAHSTHGVSWKDGKEAGELIPINAFHIAFPGTDTAASINEALASGKHILFTPGIYSLEETIRVSRENTIILGIGLPTLVPTNGKTALATDDLPGIILSGMMFDAGLTESPSLLEIGPPGSNRDHADNPSSLHDIYCRVGGAIPGTVETCLVVNSHDVIIDHTWLWRADHGAGAEWEVNKAKHGIVVNGDDVTIFGLFNEHFQEYQTLWNGERGRTYFYQSEIPYDPPSQDLWMSGETLGYASYKVADHVESHHAWGLGIYSFFGVRADSDPGVRLHSAIEGPEKPGIQFTHITTFAGRYGGINHPINDFGPRTDAKELKFFDPASENP